jgi:hypothetical protein
VSAQNVVLQCGKRNILLLFFAVGFFINYNKQFDSDNGERKQTNQAEG